MTIGRDVELAVRLLRQGGVVAFPTETVYGLGARADSTQAVRRIFEIKQRPATHPLIVHIRSAAEVSHFAVSISVEAEALMAAFWPGPLTLVFRRQPWVLLQVTGGLETVALRVPNHPVAQALLEELNLGVAAPSANRFTEVSPTRSEHVEKDLGQEVDYILDGGPSLVGIESTIVDVSGPTVAVLRPGAVTQEQLETVLNRPVPVLVSNAAVRVPGQHPLHYAPRAEVVLLNASTLTDEAVALSSRGVRVGVLFNGIATRGFPSSVVVYEVRGGTEGLARELYHALRQLDDAGVDVILACAPELGGLGVAVNDRLAKAAGPRA
ncbi:MAG: L-threonylcarbamoyladenylate synthase [Polyangiaceae bacterium]|nr:L-threonylcarbamoyladenylate synthase [Polyangiaceae bacterium]